MIYINALIIANTLYEAVQTQIAHALFVVV